MPTRAWWKVLDEMEGAMARLDAAQVPVRSGKAAAEKAKRIEKMLWRWRLSVEAAYLERSYDIAAVANQAAKQEGKTFGEILAELVDSGGLSLHGPKVLAYARSLGFDPETYLSEKWLAELEDEKKKEDDERKEDDGED